MKPLMIIVSAMLMLLAVAVVVLTIVVSSLAATVEDLEYVRVTDECVRCRNDEAKNWEGAISRRSRFEDCCWDIVEPLLGKPERKVFEEYCWEKSGGGDDE